MNKRLVIWTAFIMATISQFSFAEEGDHKEEASRPALNCEFNKYSNWKQFLSFDSKPTQLFSVKNPSDDWEERKRLDLYKIGKVTSGPCKEAEVLLGRSVSNCPSKEGGESLYVFGAAFETEKYNYDKTFENQEGDDCVTDFRAIKLGNVIYGKASQEDTFKKLLKIAKRTEDFVESSSADYKEYAFGKVLNFEHPPSKTKLALENTAYGFDLDRGVDLSKYEKIATDPILGDLYLLNRRVMVHAPDHTITHFNPGLEVDRAQYWYLDYLDKVGKSLGFTENDLTPLKGEPNWFEIKGRDHKAFSSLYSGYKDRVKAVNSRIASSNEFSKGNKVKPMSLTAYVEEKPLLFFKDKLGKYQVFRKILHEIPSLVEPIIYLYAKSPKEVSVRLCKNLKINATWPIYRSSWMVRAKEDGQIIDLKSGKKFPYLFWEGFAGHIPPYERGWVVARDQLSALFDQILPAYGLNEVEVADFKRYWVRTLNRAPYYQIEILPQSWVDLICPVSINPKPSEFLRVHMRAYELLQPKDIQAPNAPPPFKRTEFTAVEWGGFVN